MPSIYYQDPGATLYQGHVLEVLAALPEESVQCVVTSPPYWGLRDYGLPPSDWPEVRFRPMAGLEEVVVPAWRGCLGLEPEPMAYVGHLVEVFRALRRVLRPDGVAWLNLGDSYTGARGGGQGATGQMADREASRLAVRERYETRIAPGLAFKNLVGIPWRVALALQSDGWWLRSECIWAKPNPMPESVTDRPTKAHEQVFLLAKSEEYHYDAQAIQEPLSPGSAERYRYGFGGAKDVAAQAQGLRTRPVGERIATAGRNKRSVWSIASQPYEGAHFATMPPELARVPIRAGARPGDVVLDPFSGAGTTGLVALQEGRRFVGSEMSPDYCALAVKRWRDEGAGQGVMFAAGEGC